VAGWLRGRCGKAQHNRNSFCRRRGEKVQEPISVLGDTRQVQGKERKVYDFAKGNGDQKCKDAA